MIKLKSIFVGGLEGIKAFFTKGGKTRLILIGLLLLFITTTFVKCGQGKENKSLDTEAKEWKAKYEACDTAKIEITRLQIETQNKLENIEIPEPVIIGNDFSEEVRALKSQVVRNKLKQVKLIGSQQEDSIAFQIALAERDEEIDKLFGQLQECTNLSNDQVFRINQLTEMLNAKNYKDSIFKENYTARYEIKTNGTLADFDLAVDVNPLLITRTIESPAPEPVTQYKVNRLSIHGTASTNWSDWKNYEYGTGLEYQHNITKGIQGRVKYTYLPETKDHKAETSVLIGVGWKKKSN